MPKRLIESTIPRQGYEIFVPFLVVECISLGTLLYLLIEIFCQGIGSCRIVINEGGYVLSCSQVKRKDLLLGKRLEKLLIKFIIDAKVSVATVLPRRFWYTQRSAIPTEEIAIYVSEIMGVIEE